MHELSITEGILEIALTEASRASASRITLVRVKVGSFTQISPQCLQLYFQSLRDGTIAAEAELEVELIPARAQCLSCNAVFQLTDNALICPSCGSWARLTCGNELLVDSIEVEEHIESGVSSVGSH